jgi:hypothetical protein
MEASISFSRARIVPRRHRSSRRHLRHGQRAAVVRAITAAKLYLDKSASTLAHAAECCGSCVPYVRAATVLVRSEDVILINHVQTGRVSLTEAAAKVARRAELISAYQNAAEEDRVAVFRALNAERVFDVIVKAAQ